MPQSPAELANLFIMVGCGGLSVGTVMVFRGLRRVNPADIIEGSVLSISTDQSGNVRAAIEYTDRHGQKQKGMAHLDYHPSLGEIIPLILPPGKTEPKVHVANRRESIIWGLVLFSLSAVVLAMGVIYKSRQ